MLRTLAMASICFLSSFVPALAATTLLVVLHVSTEGLGWSEFAEFVTDHGLSDENWNVLATVVNRNGVSEHGWTIIERRDQVLITFLLLASFCTRTFFIRCSSTKGPFFRLLGI